MIYTIHYTIIYILYYHWLSPIIGCFQMWKPPEGFPEFPEATATFNLPHHEVPSDENLKREIGFLFPDRKQ